MRNSKGARGVNNSKIVNNVPSTTSGTEVNPFLHVILHAVAEKQVEDREPIEAFQFCNAMLRNKCSRHEAIHLLNTILVRFIYRTLKERTPFPLDSYRKILKEYKSRKPEKINRLLEDSQIDE